METTPAQAAIKIGVKTQSKGPQSYAYVISRVKVGLIAKKLNRSPGAVYARINSLKKPPHDIAFGRQPRSLPSERLTNAKALNSGPER